jgi:4-amino-4-deoxy-L-arabinose transferase-like glycosyltransferase
MLSAAAFLFKVVYLSPLALAAFMLLVELWQVRSKAGVWRAAVMRGLWIGSGFAAGLLPVVAYFGLLGLLPRFFLVFTIGRNYVNFRNTASVGPEYLLFYPFLTLAANNIVLFTLSITGLLLMVINVLRRHHPEQSKRLSTVFYIAVWYILSFIEAGITRANFSHYYLLIVPPLALLAAWFLCKMYHDVRNQVRAVSCFVATLLLTLLLTVALSISVALNFNYYHRYTRYKLGLETYQVFLLNGTRWGQGLMRVQRLADYVREHTSPADYIYYWSGDTQIYYLADRRCSIDIIWPLYAEATGPYQRIFSPQTKYVILGESNNIPRPDWLYAELAGEYTLETVI